MLDDVAYPAMTYNTVVMGKRKLFRTIVLIGLGIILALGCQPENGGDTPVASLEGNEYSTLVITSTITPLNTLTLAPSDTPFTSLTPTWEPIPTLPPDEALAAMLAIYENNGGCELPCWWGVVPGETTIYEVYERFSPIGDFRIYPANENHEEAEYRLYFDVPDENDPEGAWWFQILLKDYGTGIVHEMNTYGETVMPAIDLSLANVLSTYGRPAEILIFVGPNGPSLESNYFYIDIYYPDLGIIVGISWDGLTAVSSDSATICPQRKSQALHGILLWNPTNIAVYERDKREVQSRGSRSLGEVSELDLESFYNIYVDPNTSMCFETPREFWD